LILEAWDGDDAKVVSGRLHCPGCYQEYPIEDGIVRMLPIQLQQSAEAKAPEDEVSARKISEMHARDQQVEDYDRMWHLTLFGKLEVPLTLRHLSVHRTQHELLEAGCGTGRMTREFAGRCRHLVSLDFSWESLKVNAAKLRADRVQNVDLVQADICHLPLRAGAFDRVVSCQLLEHVNGCDARAMAVGELARVLKTQGVLVISAYKHSIPMRLLGRKEGEHAGGIYYYRFHQAEFRELLGRHLNVEAMTGVLVYHYIARCRKPATVRHMAFCARLNKIHITKTWKER